jgi:hypothetical protein
MSNVPNPTTHTITDLVNTVNSNLPDLPQEKSYTLGDLAGEEYWNAIPKGRRTSLGLTFKALAVSGELPVTYAGSTSSNKALYEHK